MDDKPGGDDVRDSAEVEVQAEEEETEPRQSPPSPQMPTQSEIHEHNIDHIPYRHWCKHCVEGYGRERAHAASGEKPRSIPLISCDYLFMTNRGVFARKEFVPVEGEEVLKVLVAYDSSTRAIFAHAVPRKGPDEFGYVVDQIVRDIVWLGHAKVVIRTDNEPAIVKLIVEALKALKVAGVEQASAEGSVPYDPQTNGAAESAVGTIKGMLRTLTLCLEEQIGARIPVGHPLLTWLVRHAAWCRTSRIRGSDGRTAYEKARGRAFKTPMVGFAEHCRYKVRAQEKRDDGLPWRWYTGIFVGIDLQTGQYIFYDTSEKGGIRHARTLMRLLDPQKWSADLTAKVHVTPWAPYVERALEVTFREPVEKVEQEGLKS